MVGILTANREGRPLNFFLNFKYTLFIVLFFVVAHAVSQPMSSKKSQQRQPELKRQKIGLVLGGGGARGASHIGVLRELERMRVPVDYIAGTSMGAIIGGLYASGLTPDEIEEAVNSIDWVGLFNDDSPREDLSFRRKRDDTLNLIGAKLGVSADGVKLSKAVVQGQKFDLELNRLTQSVAQVENFDDLAIPFRAVATDLARGEPVVLSEGHLALALRASMSVPAAFAGVEMDGLYLVDGGVSNNLPIDVVRDMGADIVIAVDLAAPLKSTEELNSSLDVIGQLVNLLTYRNAKRQVASLTAQDILIRPELGDLGSADFTRAYQAVEDGEIATKKQQGALKKWSVSTSHYSQYLTWRQGYSIQAKKSAQQVLSFFEINNQSPLSDAFIFSRVSNQAGQVLDVSLLEKEISNLYGLDTFENIRYEIVGRDEGMGVVLHVFQKDWGPNYLQGGLAMGGDLQNDSSVNVSLAYTRTMMNAYNAEWRTFLQMGDSPKLVTEWYQPLDVNSRFYINPGLLLADRYTLQSFDDDYAVGEQRVHRYGASFAAGVELGAWGDLRLTWKRFKGETEARIGQPSREDEKFNIGELNPSLFVDKLDSFNFPKEGHLLYFEWVNSQEDFGADVDFDQYRFDSAYAKTWSRQTFFAGFKLNTTPDDNAPFQNEFRAGGFQNLSGYQFNELNGQHFALLRIGTMRQISDFQLAPAYIGATFELGDVANDADTFLQNQDNLIAGGNIFLGLDTGIGSLYFAYGNSEGGEDSFYMYLGKLFPTDY